MIFDSSYHLHDCHFEKHTTHASHQLCELLLSDGHSFENFKFGFNAIWIYYVELRGFDFFFLTSFSLDLFCQVMAAKRGKSSFEKEGLQVEANDVEVGKRTRV